MKTILKKMKIDKHNGWRAYFWDGHETKEQSICIIEIDPGKSLDHIHLNPKETETEIVLEGEATYSGDINYVLKPAEIIEQRGRSKLISIKNNGSKPLRILCINHPPWKPSDEKILTK